MAEGSGQEAEGKMQPQKHDAVLGSTTPAATGSVVLGGLEGIRQRLKSPIATHRLAALQEAQKLGQDSLELVIRALRDESVQVQKAAYALLQGRREAVVIRALQAFDTYPLFECLGTLEGHSGGITAVAIAPDGRTIISASRDKTLKIWDWWAQEEVFTIQIRSVVYTITVSPSGETFTVRDNNQTFTAWSLRNGQQIQPEDLQLRVNSSVTVSTDRVMISGSQKVIKVWNLNTGRETCCLKGHTSLVTAVAICPDPPLIISGSEDKTVKVWGIGRG